MSWQTYVDDHLMCDIDGTGHHLSAAAIIGHDGSVWAQSSAFPQVCNNLQNLFIVLSLYTSCDISEVFFFYFVLFFQVKSDEINGIMKDFDEPGYLAPTGLHLAGTKYMVIQGEPGAVIRGKKVYIIFFIDKK